MHTEPWIEGKKNRIYYTPRDCLTLVLLLLVLILRHGPDRFEGLF